MTEETTDYGPVAEGQVVNFPIGDLEHGNETYLIPFCKVNIAISFLYQLVIQQYHTFKYKFKATLIQSKFLPI